MARPLRIEFAGAWYHVMNRGAGRKTVFTTPWHHATFLDLLRDIHDRYRVESHAYCLMGNHYHLLLHTPEPNLGRAMRHVDGVYTQRYNRLEPTDGPLFRGRYKAIVVDATAYLTRLSRYIHRNPVEGRVAADPADYAWSSYRFYLGERPAPDWLYLQPTLGLFGPGRTRARYRAFVETDVDEELREFYSAERRPPVLGSEHFRANLSRRVDPSHALRETPDARRLAPRPSIGVIITVTARHFGLPAETLRRIHPGRRSPARAVAMALCRSPGGYALRNIALAFGAGSYTTVAMAIQRLGRKLDEEAFAARVAEIKSELFPPV